MSSFIFSSNAERLSLKDWIIVLAIFLGIIYFFPMLWLTIEKFEPAENYRMPYMLSDDYWMFKRTSKYSSSKFPALIIGDSFVWGQYVSMEQTLPHILNEMDGQTLFANMGLDGLHPAAMVGLLKYFGKDISNKGVILHLNLLWMSSEKHDLKTKEEFRFNHPRLVPQFIPNLDCYKAPLGEKISVLLERYISLFTWERHVKNVYFENMDIPNWTILNPYKLPFNAISFKIPSPENRPKSRPVQWTEQRIKIQDFPWVEPEKSFQWASFKKTLKILNDRNNHVFVIIGPFNPYILTENSLVRYNLIKSKIEKWFKENKILYYSPSFLPSELYADASHPLKEGYTLIAEKLYKEQSYKEWMENLKSSL